MRTVQPRWRQPREVRRALRVLARERVLVRVTLPSGVSFVGIPILDRRAVRLYNQHGAHMHTVAVRQIAAVSRTQWKVSARAR